MSRPAISVNRPTDLHSAGRSYFSFSLRLMVLMPAMKSLPRPIMSTMDITMSGKSITATMIMPTNCSCVTGITSRRPKAAL